MTACWWKLGRPVKLVLGSYRNIKLTTPEDMIVAAALLEALPGAVSRTGAHAETSGWVDMMFISWWKAAPDSGRCCCPHEKGLGPSDADVLLHAVMDAAWGAGLGDRSQYFPDTDPKWRQTELLRQVGSIIASVQTRKPIISTSTA